MPSLCCFIFTLSDDSHSWFDLTEVPCKAGCINFDCLQVEHDISVHVQENGTFWDDKITFGGTGSQTDNARLPEWK